MFYRSEKLNMFLSDERYRRVFISSISSLIAKGIGILFQIITIPLLLNYLGEERYGIFIIITSFVSILVFADLGLGNGIINFIGKSKGLENDELERKVLNTAIFTLFSISIFLILALQIFFPKILSITDYSVDEKFFREFVSATKIFLILFIINVPLSLIQKLRMGKQQIFINDIFKIISASINFIGFFLAVQFDLGIEGLVWATNGAIIISNLLNLTLFLRNKNFLYFSINLFSRELMLKILQNGFLFFVMQLAGVIAFQTNFFVIGAIIGPSAVTQYSIPAKLFSSVSMLVGFVLMPLWPAYREAFSKGDVSWVKKTFIRSLKFGLAISIFATILLIIFGRRIIDVWVGDSIKLNLIFLILLGVSEVICTISGCFSMLLNGANRIFEQTIISLTMSCVNFGLSIHFTRLFGISGPVLGTIIAHSLFTIIPSFLLVLRTLRSHKARLL